MRIPNTGHPCPPKVQKKLFFPAPERGAEFEAQVAAAKAVCVRCPVVSECLAWALNALPYGIAGGLTEQERRRDRIRRREDCGGAVPARPMGGSLSEVAAAGLAAMRAGLPVREVAREFGVSARTAARWAAQVRTDDGTSAAASGRRAEGSRGGHRAPLLFSRATQPLAGTRAAEGLEGR
jgi:hypothetical protein